MKAAELRTLGRQLHGPRWKGKLAAQLEVDASTLRRWLLRDAVPGPAAAAVRCFVRERKREGGGDGERLCPAPNPVKG